MAIKELTKEQIENINKQEEKILTLLKSEQKRAKEKFPLTYALLATFGVACVFAGLNRIIAKIDFLDTHPITLVALGLVILLFTGAAYKKLG